MSGKPPGWSRRDVVNFVFAAAAVLILVWLEFFPPKYSADPLYDELWRVTVSRLAGALLFLPAAIVTGYRVYGVKRGITRLDLLTVAAAAVVVINNFPFIGVISGNAVLTREGKTVALFALYCLSIGLFEEIAFRGVLFLSILEGRRGSKKEIFISTVAASALFGAVHLVNLIAGAAPGGVFLQVGYSFLIGGMCSIVLLRTGCVWICVILHFVFDFAGYLIPKLGDGIIWDPVTVALTAAIGVAVLAFMLYVMSRTGPEDIDFIFRKKEGKTEDEDVES